MRGVVSVTEYSPFHLPVDVSLPLPQAVEKNRPRQRFFSGGLDFIQYQPTLHGGNRW
jgi:hypothetical protein